MSFENFKFDKAVPVTRDCGRKGVDYVFASDDGSVETTVTQTDLFNSIMEVPDENGINPVAGVPHELVMDAYASEFPAGPKPGYR